jgi:hypothetical protein
MACGEIASIQVEMLRTVRRRDQPHIEIGVVAQATTLAAIGFECRHRHARRHAGTAANAMRAIHERAGAAESQRQRFGIGFGQCGIVRVEHQVARDATWPVAAGVFGGVVKAHRMQRGHQGMLTAMPSLHDDWQAPGQAETHAANS